MFCRASWFRWRAKPLIGVLFLAVLVGAFWYFRQSPVNVVLITLDTTRADRLGVYGYQDGLTASFDQLVEGGVVFERAYAPAPITLPSHASMLTGLYPPEHGLRVNGQGRLAREVMLLPEVLKRQGFETAAFISAAVLNAAYGLDRGFDLYDDFTPKNSADSSQRHRRHGKDVVDHALSWLAGRRSRPFFCWIHLFDAHAPYDSREQIFGDRFKENPYDAGIAAELQQVERVFAYLKEHHLDQNTLVIIAGDHGEGLGDHRELEHGMLAYNSTLHVPLMFVGTGHCKPRQRVSTAVSLVDITPTVLDILKIQAPSHVSGRSLIAALEGGEAPGRPIYAEAESPYVFNRWSPLHAVISDGWKFIRTTRPELYDLRNDFSEQNDLANSATAERQELENVLEVMQQSFVSFAPQQLQLSPKDLADLKHLGYVGLRKPVAHADRGDAGSLKDIKDMLPILEKFEQAKELSLKGKVDLAIPLLNEIEVEGDPGEFLEAGLLLGDCLVVSNRLDEAVARFRRILEKHPEFAPARFRLGSALARQGKLEQAVGEFRQVIKEEPATAPAHCELARLLVKMQKPDDAVKEYQETIRIAPDASNAQVELGQLLMRLKRPRDAATCFEQALKHNPRDGVAQANLWGVLVQLGELKKALDYGKKAVEIDPKSFEARYNLGAFLISQKRFQEGIEQLREAQKLRPDEPGPSQQIKQAEAAMKKMGNR